MCNAEVFGQAIATAADDAVDLLVFPEAYALSRPSRDGYWENLFGSDSSSRANACNSADPLLYPLQKQLSCLAAKHSVALAYNIFASRNGSNRITEIVVDNSGTLLTTYDKVHLFPVLEAAHGATPGTNPPTTFTLLGQRFGIIICYEGVYPWLPGGSWSQMEDLKAQNATSWIWSIGSSIPIQSAASKLANKFGVNIVATQDKSWAGAGEIICSDSYCSEKEAAVQNCVSVDKVVHDLPKGYKGKPFVRSVVLP